jgi:hypothetical protein
VTQPPSWQVTTKGLPWLFLQYLLDVRLPNLPTFFKAFMSTPLDRAADFLRTAQNQDGGWGYSARAGQSAPEASCYSLLALTGRASESVRDGLSWLESRIGADGGVRLEGDDEIHWSTSLAALTLRRLAPGAGKLTQCLDCLITLHGTADTGVGWAWTDQTYSWVEPTCYAVLALKAAGWARHTRVREAEDTLHARICKTGGWNQGLLKSFNRELTGLPAQTALAILALQDHAESESLIDHTAEWLASEVSSQPTVLTLAWSTLALNAIGRNENGFPAELERRQQTDGSWRSAVHLTALSMLALMAAGEGRNVFKI